MFRIDKDRYAIVLGCGPAGMFATHALVSSGWNVEVWSNKKISDIYGAQYLHRSIPDILYQGEQYRAQQINYLLVGDPAGYASKVYGDLLHSEKVSPEYLSGGRPVTVWDIRQQYHAAYRRYAHLITDMTIGPERLMALHHGDADLVISTIPAKALCLGGHQFVSADIWAAGDAPDRGIFVPIPCEEGTVVCSGEPDTGWYRKSRIFGHTTVEWAGERPPIACAKVSKPIRSNCTCFPSFVRLGRYGAWKKGYLSHEAYFDALGLASTAAPKGRFGWHRKVQR